MDTSSPSNICSYTFPVLAKNFKAKLMHHTFIKEITQFKKLSFPENKRTNRKYFLLKDCEQLNKICLYPDTEVIY